MLFLLPVYLEVKKFLWDTGPVTTIPELRKWRTQDQEFKVILGNRKLEASLVWMNLNSNKTEQTKKPKTTILLSN